MKMTDSEYKLRKFNVDQFQHDPFSGLVEQMPKFHNLYFPYEICGYLDVYILQYFDADENDWCFACSSKSFRKILRVSKKYIVKDIPVKILSVRSACFSNYVRRYDTAVFRKFYDGMKKENAEKEKQE